MTRLTRAVSFAIVASLSAGCASTIPPVVTDTQLGTVVIYRNGVAYFERSAPAAQKTLTLRVPAARVDDFLKSLSVIDEDSGKALPISYPTLQVYRGYTNMAITLPAAHGPLLITYVTESPAWKPSYRVVLDDRGEATLQGWAVVDNVSGEDWKQVRVGVGSTSALSFRYDLHSVRLVRRQTLGGAEALAAAPPTGGSAYAVATKKVRMLGSLSQADLGLPQTEVFPEEMATATARDYAPGPAAELDESDQEQTETLAAPPAPRRGTSYLRGLATKLKNNNTRVRIEGYAQRGDADTKSASLARANRVREQLVKMGVPMANIDVVGTGTMGSRDAVRILEGEAAGGGARPGFDHTVAARDTQPLGQAHFVSRHTLTIEDKHSAMVSILKQQTKAKRVYYYDPVSERGSKRYAFNAVHITNPTDNTLDSGPFTVYAAGQFLGEGLSEAIVPHGQAFVPYALDRAIIVETKHKRREEIQRLLTIVRGIVSTETRRIRTTTLSISNRSKLAAEVFVRHKLTQGFELATAHQQNAQPDKLGGAYLFPITVPAGDAVELTIEEWTPLMKTVDIRTHTGIQEMALFLKKRNIQPPLRDKLDDIIRTHMRSADLSERQRTLRDQMEMYRTREQELGHQLSRLRKVPQAAKLRTHLSEKMAEISDKLQQATLALSDLSGEQMTIRIALQDKLAELTLKRPANNPTSTVAHK